MKVCMEFTLWRQPATDQQAPARNRERSQRWQVEPEEPEEPR
jgi:hypothetical protein